MDVPHLLTVGQMVLNHVDDLVVCAGLEHAD